MENYNKQAEEFLSKTNTTVEVMEAVPQKSPLWSLKDKHGINYTVTLKNDNHAYSFDYWGSIRDAELINLAMEAKDTHFESSHEYAFRDELKKRKLNFNPLLYRFQPHKLMEVLKKYLLPNAYDILACLFPVDEDNFYDFCGTYGYNADSINALNTYNACIEQDRNLRKLFNHKQLEKLAEIN